MSHNPDVKHDWDQLFNEWVSSGQSLSAFQQARGIARTYFFRRTARLGWAERARELRSKAREKTDAALADHLAARWRRQSALWETIEDQCEVLLKRSLKKKAPAIDRMNPAQLAALANALERALKARRLISGEATEISEAKGGENLHLQVVRFLAETRRTGESL